jgi:uncharacterized protein (DUF1786 family)
LQILAIDIGLGTQDILLYEGKGSPENCPKLVLPSPALLYRQRLKGLLVHQSDLFLDGSIIGGGGLTSSLIAHLRSGFSVFMTKAAAFSLRNDLNEVREKGIQIVEQGPPHFSGQRLTLKEIDFASLSALLAPWDIDLSRVRIAAIAVQDHGVSPPGTSNRRLRLQRIQEGLKRDSRPTSLAFFPEEIPASHLRMQAAADASQSQLPGARPLLMDTSLAAIAGCLVDPLVAARWERPILCVNLGNGHTMAALLKQGKILALLEHHTRTLSPEALEKALRRFSAGNLREEEVFEEGGHGLFYLQEAPGLSALGLIAVTGPQRELMRRTSLDFYYPAPYGDMMMTGPAGLIWAAKERFSGVA